MSDRIIYTERKRRGLGCGTLAILALIGFGYLLMRNYVKSFDADIAREQSYQDAERRAAASSDGNVPKASAPATEAKDEPARISWDHSVHTDAITDEVTHMFLLFGLPLREMMDYRPLLVIRISETDLQRGDWSSAKVWVQLELDHIRRAGVNGVVRIDKRPAEDVFLSPNSTRDAFVLPGGYASKLDGAQILVIRFTSSLDAIRTLRFNLEGMTLAKLQAMSGVRPKHQTTQTDELIVTDEPSDPMPELTQCNQCNGEGVLHGYRKCPKCKGKGCKACATSPRKGRIPATKQCPHCNGSGKVPKD